MPSLTGANVWSFQQFRSQQFGLNNQKMASIPRDERGNLHNSWQYHWVTSELQA